MKSVALVLIGLLSVVAWSCSDDTDSGGPNGSNGGVLDAIGASDECKICANASCESQLSACNSDTTCVEIFPCVTACAGDDNCVNGCMAQSLGPDEMASCETGCEAWEEQGYEFEDLCIDDCWAGHSPGWAKTIAFGGCMERRCPDQCDDDDESPPPPPLPPDLTE